MEKKKMKILLTTELYTPSINGVVTSILTLKHALEQRGHEVRVLTLSEKRSFSDSDVYTAPSYGVGKIYPGARYAFSTDEEVCQEMIEWSPDIIHTHCEFSTFRMAKHIARVLDVPIVHTYHTVYEDYTHYFSPKKTWGKKIVSIFSRRVLKHASTVIVPSHKVEAILNNYGITSPIHVVPTGLPLEKFNQDFSEEEIRTLKKTYSIPEKNHLLVTVSRLAKEKNVDEILYYLARLNDPTLSLLIAGDGPYRQRLEELVHELHLEDTCRFTGMVAPDDIAKYYQLGDIFVSSSTSETQGLTYIEALASGLPALCRKDTCLSDVIQEGVNGYQFTTFSEFEERLYSMLFNAPLRKQLSKQAKAFAQETYSSKRFGERIEEIYLQETDKNSLLYHSK